MTFEWRDERIIDTSALFRYQKNPLFFFGAVFLASEDEGYGYFFPLQRMGVYHGGFASSLKPAFLHRCHTTEFLRFCLFSIPYIWGLGVFFLTRKRQLSVIHDKKAVTGSRVDEYIIPEKDQY